MDSGRGMWNPHEQRIEGCDRAPVADLHTLRPIQESLYRTGLPTKSCMGWGLYGIGLSDGLTLNFNQVRYTTERTILWATFTLRTIITNSNFK